MLQLYYTQSSMNVILLFFLYKKVDKNVDCVKLYVQLENRRTKWHM